MRECVQESRSTACQLARAVLGGNGTYVSQNGQADVDEQICATAGDHEDADRWDYEASVADETRMVAC
jgi:hypothetical protein